MLAHGQDDLRRKRHSYRLKVSGSLIVRDRCALRGTSEKFTHSDYNLPINLHCRGIQPVFAAATGDLSADRPGPADLSTSSDRLYRKSCVRRMTRVSNARQGRPVPSLHIHSLWFHIAHMKWSTSVFLPTYHTPTPLKMQDLIDLSRLFPPQFLYSRLLAYC